MKIHFTINKCFLGLTLIAINQRGVCAIFFGDDAKQLTEDLQQRFPHTTLMLDDQACHPQAEKIIAFIKQPTGTLDAPLDLEGSAFQLRVWQALMTIPLGTTLSYRDVAKSIGAPTSIRAVASACAANKLAVVVPCHRVVKSDGTLSGYRWGIPRKQALLAREGLTSRIA